MGMATCKSGDIYDQPFFRGVNWKAVEELKVEPPFVPEVVSYGQINIGWCLLVQFVYHYLTKLTHSLTLVELLNLNTNTELKEGCPKF